MGAILTERHKTAIRLKLSQTPPEERANLIGMMRSSGQVPAEVLSFVESVNVELRLAEQRQAQAFREKPPVPEVREMTPEEIRAFWKAAGHVGMFVTVSGGIVAGFVYVVIPALIAVGKAIVIAAPYVVGAAVVGLGIVSFIQSLRRPADKPAGEPEILVRTTTITETFRQ